MNIHSNFNSNIPFTTNKTPSFCASHLRELLTNEEKKLLKKYSVQYDLKKQKPVSLLIKTVSDKILASFGLILTAPIVLLSALAIKLESKGPAIYKQQRIGKNCEPFTMYKLRTMYDDTGDDFFQLTSANDKHITKTGKFLRKYSINEFPQFINILKGDMSLIGPRPIVKEVHDEKNVSPDFLKRYVVKPGAKLQYTSNKMESAEDTIKVENNYVNNWNLSKDFNTFFSIVKDIVSGNNY